MAGSPGLLNFFVLEASEYVEQLDRLLGAAGVDGPDDEAFTRTARALRGAATMAKLNGLAALAASVERTGRALRERALRWEPALQGALTGAVDDLKILVRSARTWGEAEEARAQSRAAELLGFVPAGVRAPSSTPSAPPPGGAMFVVSGTADVAASLAAAAARPAERDLLSGALRRLRALRGLVALRDHPPLAEALERIEEVAQRGVESGTPDAATLAYLNAAARYLRRAAEEVRAGRPVSGDSPEARAFEAAERALAPARRTPADVVPVAALFPDQPGAHVVHAAEHPPERAWARFRLEAVGQAEHLRRLVADARRGGEDARRRVADGVRALAGAARSFGEPGLAQAVLDAAHDVESGDPLALTAADLTAALLVDGERPPGELTERITELGRARTFASIVGVGLQPITRRRATTGSTRRVTPPPQPAAAPSRATPSAGTAPAAGVEHAPRATPTGRELQSLLASSIAGIERLDQEPLAAPPPAPEPPPVPVETLLYRGPAALQRAREVREELQRRGGTPDPELLAELYDLLDLAAG